MPHTAHLTFSILWLFFVQTILAVLLTNFVQRTYELTRILVTSLGFICLKAFNSSSGITTFSGLLDISYSPVNQVTLFLSSTMCIFVIFLFDWFVNPVRPRPICYIMTFLQFINNSITNFIAVGWLTHIDRGVFVHPQQKLPVTSRRVTGNFCGGLQKPPCLCV